MRRVKGRVTAWVKCAISVGAALLAVSTPFIGYKVSADFGLTFDSQLGFQFVVAQVEAESGGAMAQGEASDVIPLLNLNLGWAF